MWKYYTTENLFTGPMFDLELINEMEHSLDDEPSGDGAHDTLGRCMSGCYGDVTQFTRDECSHLLQELSRLEDEADQKPRRWEQVWHKLDYPPAPKRPVSWRESAKPFEKEMKGRGVKRWREGESPVVSVCVLLKRRYVSRWGIESCFRSGLEQVTAEGR